MPKKILLLTQWFDPEPTFKGLVFARELVQSGFDVEVVTGFPNYPGGIIYDGYKIKLLQKEIIDGVNVARVPLYPNHDSSALRRIFNYVSFAFTSLIYCLFFAKKADVIYAYHPPLTVGVVAIVIRFFRRIPVVYDIQDMWPDTLQSTGMINNKKTLKVIGKVAKWVYNKVDRIVVLSPGFKNLLVERSVPESKIDVIPNWCDEESMSEPTLIEAIPFIKDKRFKIIFAGNMGRAQSLDTVLKAAEILQEQGASILFAMVGGGVEVERLKSVYIKKGLKNIEFYPPVPMGQVGAYLSSADALLVHLKNDPLFEITIPSKTQAYMSVGRPILMGVKGDAADIIRKADAGIVFEPENARSLAEAILEISQKDKDSLTGLGDNAKKYYLKHLSLKVGVSSFSKIFTDIIKK